MILRDKRDRKLHGVGKCNDGSDGLWGLLKI